MKLFSEDFGEVKTDEELASLQQQFSHYDPGYITQSACVSRRGAKEWMEKLWELYEPYADQHFVEDFKRQFIQRSWELYLGATLLNHGFKLGKHNPVGPDFDIRNEKDERLVWVEATATDKGSGKDRVPDIVYGIVSSVPEKEMLLRVTNALDKKFKRYQEELKRGIIKENESYVIAINRSDLPYPDPFLPLILKVVFGVGHLTLRINVDGVRQLSPESYWSRRSKIAKRSGKEVPTLFFEDENHAGISAVIYCTDNILNSPRAVHEMGENLILVHNPLARNPLPDHFLPFGDEYKLKADYINKIRDRKDWEKHSPF